MEFLDWEFGVFFHFGIRSFYEGHTDWDMKEMPLEGFNPTSLDVKNGKGDAVREYVDACRKYGVKVGKNITIIL